MARRIRIGIDTGGTFTDVVAFDEDTGDLVTTKTPSTPANPADGFITGVEKVLRSEEHTSELQSQFHLVCPLLLEKKKKPRRRNWWNHTKQPPKRPLTTISHNATAQTPA